MSWGGQYARVSNTKESTPSLERRRNRLRVTIKENVFGNSHPKWEYEVFFQEIFFVYQVPFYPSRNSTLGEILLWGSVSQYLWFGYSWNHPSPPPPSIGTEISWWAHFIFLAKITNSGKAWDLIIEGFLPWSVSCAEPLQFKTRIAEAHLITTGEICIRPIQGPIGWQYNSSSRGRHFCPGQMLPTGYQDDNTDLNYPRQTRTHSHLTKRWK